MATWGLATSALVLATATALLAVASTTTAQYSQKDYVDLHNAVRAESGVFEEVRWDESVAAYAEWYAGQRSGDCAMQHSDSFSYGYGENLSRGGGGGGGWDWTAADAVGMWAAERQYYDYDSNTCADGQMCGHYTQVVWRDTTAIGCARVVCDGDQGIFITCNYSPPGNWEGQRPYMAARTTA